MATEEEERRPLVPQAQMVERGVDQGIRLIQYVSILGSRILVWCSHRFRPGDSPTFDQGPHTYICTCCNRLPDLRLHVIL